MATQTSPIALPHSSGENALLVFIPLPTGASLTAFRLLAQFTIQPFFQQMRVEKQLGYVASSRYLRCADRDGLLFALQSSKLAPMALYDHCQHFLADLVIPDQATIEHAQHHFIQQLARLTPKEQALNTLRQLNGLASYDPHEPIHRDQLITLQAALLTMSPEWLTLFTSSCGNSLIARE